MHAQALYNLRFILASLVAFLHLTLWYSTAGIDINPVYQDFMSAFNIFFRTGGETSPAVLWFIVLSGYCIHRSFDGNLSHYIKHRAYRIIPLFVLGTVLGALALIIFATPEIIAFLETELITPLSLFYKLVGAQAFFPGLFEATYQGNAPLETVAVEIWLYAFYPIGLVLLKRLGAARFLAVLVVMTLLGSLAVIYDPSLRPWWNNGSFLGFLTYWWIGMYFHNEKFCSKIKQLRYQLIIAYLFLTCFILVWPYNSLGIELRKLALALIGGLVIVRLDFASSYRRGLAELTQSSYSLYALHTPVIVACVYYNVKAELAFLLSILVAYLSYRFVERPLYYYAKRTSYSPQSSLG
ncbi:MAG: acyltransferase family protein [Rickettsiales bacterium]